MDGMTASGRDAKTTERMHELADLLALGYLRARNRKAAQVARSRRMQTSSNALDDVPPEATLVPGERRTSET